MGIFTTKLAACAIAAVFAVHSATMQAEEDRWFRVELLAFANLSTTPPVGAALLEQWDATPALAYPEAARFLVDPARVAENAAEFDGESVLDEYGRQIITILVDNQSMETGLDGTGSELSPDSSAGAAANSATRADPAPKPLTPVYSEPVATAQAIQALPETSAETQQEKPPELPRPFVILPEKYQEFRGKAALMQRSGGYSILFHETWVQPVVAEEDSLPIVLDRSGDEQLWPPLQGSIKIFLARYLLLETNLWLNTPGEYLPGSWQMPPPPFGPQSLIIEEEAPIDLAAEIDRIPDQAVLEEGSTAVATVDSGASPEGARDVVLEDEAPAAVDQLAQAESTELRVEPGELAESVEPGEYDEFGELVEPETEQAAAPVYPYRHAVLLDQKRRMRSNEVHYIDHPKLGIIIKFTPVTAQELALIAESQASTPEDTQAP